MAVTGAAPCAFRSPELESALGKSFTADAAKGVQQPRFAAGLGLLTQVADVDAERVGVGAEVVAPDVLEDHRAREHLARMAQEQLEQLELGPRQQQRSLVVPSSTRCAQLHKLSSEPWHWPGSAARICG